MSLCHIVSDAAAVTRETSEREATTANKSEKTASSSRTIWRSRSGDCSVCEKWIGNWTKTFGFVNTASEEDETVRRKLAALSVCLKLLSFSSWTIPSRRSNVSNVNNLRVESKQQQAAERNSLWIYPSPFFHRRARPNSQKPSTIADEWMLIHTSYKLDEQQTSLEDTSSFNFSHSLSAAFSREHCESSSAWDFIVIQESSRWKRKEKEIYCAH